MYQKILVSAIFSGLCVSRQRFFVFLRDQRRKSIRKHTTARFSRVVASDFLATPLHYGLPCCLHPLFDGTNIILSAHFLFSNCGSVTGVCLPYNNPTHLVGNKCLVSLQRDLAHHFKKAIARVDTCLLF